MSTTELGAEKKRPDIQWLKPSDYYKKMTFMYKVFYRLGIIRYSDQRFGSLYYQGFFKYNLYNPLTYIMIVTVYIIGVIVELFLLFAAGITQIIDVVSHGICVSVPVKRSES